MNVDDCSRTSLYGIYDSASTYPAPARSCGFETTRKVDVAVLGFMEVSIEEESVPLPKILRSLLGLLVAHLGEPLAQTSLIDALWAEVRPPVSASKTVQGHICRLRRLLGSDVIRCHHSAYAGEPKLIRTDISCFEQYASQAEMQFSLHDLRGAVGSADRGLAYWRGVPFDGLDIGLPLWIIPSLMERCSRVRDLRAASMIELGQSHRVIADLESMVARDPLREQSWVYLMTALSDVGRSSDALHAYGRARRALAEELGIGPGPALRNAEASILRGDVLVAVA